MNVVCDIETDSLTPEKVWLIVCKDIDSGERTIFRRPDVDQGERRRFVEYAGRVKQWIGHNFLKFDYLTVIRKFFSEVKLDPLSICDTLICSRLFNYSAIGGHSLEAWGVRLGHPKPVIKDFTQGLTDAMVHRCCEDVELNTKVYRFLEKHIKHKSFIKALELEHKMEFVCYDMQMTGFHFNIEEAKRIHAEIEVELEKLDKEIMECFPPKTKLIKEVHPKLTKKGTLSLTDFRWASNDGTLDLSPYSADSPFSLFEYSPFNPGSPSQIVERLNEAGWKPYNKTKGHIKTEQLLRRTRNKDERRELEERLKAYQITGWSVDEENLSTLPEDAPEGARKLAQRILLASRRSVLQEWFNAYNPTTGRIHGRFNGLGAWTHRMSHQAPNQGNIPSDPDVKDKNNPTPVEVFKLKYSKALRALWSSASNRRLVGVDADGIQLRILAHYMGDKDFTDALVNGDKDKGTDAHSLNAIRLGMQLTDITRARAKTFKTEVSKLIEFSGHPSGAILSQALRTR